MASHRGIRGVRVAVRRNGGEWLWFLAFAGPGLVLFGVFTYWPIARSVYLGFTHWNLLNPSPAWAGLANYHTLLRDEVFRRVCANTALYAVAVVGVAQSLALFLALVLNVELRGRTLFRVLAFTPYVTTPAAAALVWVLMLDPQAGPVAHVYHALGVQGPRWLSSPTLALWALVAVGVWKEIGFATVFFLAGLQSLPRDVLEAASVDGSGPVRTLWHILLPLLSPVVFFLLVSGLIAAAKAFDVVAIMTQGGPVYPDSSTYVYHLYRVAFRDFRAGYASALATVFFGAMVVVTYVQFRLARKWVHYEG